MESNVDNISPYLVNCLLSLSAGALTSVNCCVVRYTESTQGLSKLDRSRL